MSALTKLTEKINRKIRGKKQYYFWLISYAVIILITMIVNFFGYGIAQQVLEKENEKNNSSMVESIRGNIDANFEDAKKSAYRLLSSNSVKVYESAFNLAPDRKNDFINNIIDNISNYTSNSSFVEECILIIGKKDSCFDSLGKSDTLLAYSMFFSPYYPSREAWLEDVFADGESRFITLTAQSGEQTLFYIRQNPSYPKRATTAIIIKFDTEAIENYLEENSVNTGGRVYILDGEGNGLFGFNEGDVLIKPEGAAGSFAHKSDSGYRMVHYTASSVVDFSYVYSVSRSDYEKTVNFVRTSLTICYILCVLIGGAMAYAFTKVNYRPLNTIMRRLGDAKNANSVSEYQFIERSIDELEKNKREIEKRAKEQSRTLKKSLISQILLGGIRLNNDNREMFKDNEIMLSGQYFAVAAFDVQSAGELGEEITDDNLTLVQFVISNVLTELLENIADVDYCEINQLYVCVFSFINSADYDVIIKKAEYSNWYLNQKLGIQFVGAFSQVTDDLSKLPELYEQTTEIIGFRLLDNNKCFSTYDEMMHDISHYEYSLETQRQLMNMILSGEENDAVGLAQHIFARNLGELKINGKMFRLLVMEIAGTLIKTMAETDKQMITENHGLWTMSARVFSANNSAEIQEEIYGYVREISRLNKQSGFELKSERLEEIKEFIHKNYSNPDLNVSMIAETFHISLYHISRCFKKETGEGMAEYIIGYRIEKAKKLLKTTDIPINKIATETGFGVISSFNRTFKKYVGITPKQYRDY